ncbi:MAG TPA: esterase-like activity of phytase family protein [Beijerinckiaceae bacterium]|nr:esterase-like activity of phytase family protein [Beijerinckiaceae bacterium]
MRFSALICVVCAGLASAGLADERQAQITPLALPSLPLGVVTFGSGKAVNLSVSPGAGAFRLPSDPPGRIWTVTDRGPSIDCSEERDVIGPDDKLVCQAERRGKIYLLPGFVPSIYAIDIGAEKQARFIDMVPLKGISGKPLTGIANPYVHATSEEAFAPDGQSLTADPSGIEPGALVRLADGRFWIAEGFAPSLLEVAADGRVLRRIVPESLGSDLSSADYPVEASLPDVLSRRPRGRGFEGLAITPDESYLFGAMSSALVNPDVETYRASPSVRIIKVDRVTGRVVDQFVYVLDPPSAFAVDSGITSRASRQSDVRIVEIAALDANRLLVLERMRRHVKLYRVDLSDARPLPLVYTQSATQPSLEATPRFAWPQSRIEPLPKTLLYANPPAKAFPTKITGMALLSPNDIVLIGGNDFGIDGSRAQMFRLTFAAPVPN